MRRVVERAAIELTLVAILVLVAVIVSTALSFFGPTRGLSAGFAAGVAVGGAIGYYTIRIWLAKRFNLNQWGRTLFDMLTDLLTRDQR